MVRRSRASSPQAEAFHECRRRAIDQLSNGEMGGRRREGVVLGSRAGESSAARPSARPKMTSSAFELSCCSGAETEGSESSLWALLLLGTQKILTAAISVFHLLLNGWDQKPDSCTGNKF